MTKAQLLVTHAELVASSAYLVAMAKVVACDYKRNVMTPADLVSVEEALSQEMQGSERKEQANILGVQDTAGSTHMADKGQRSL